MSNKLDLLKKYVAIQASDNSLWFISARITENHLQQELRKMAWLVEEANEAQMTAEIEFYKGKLGII